MRHAKSIVAAGAGAALVIAGAVACGSDSQSSDFAAGDGPSNGQSDGGDGKNGGFASDPAAPTDNGVILVHAAGFPAFRLCFKNDPEALPLPTAELMPDANVAGVDVGSAVRIGALDKIPGDVFLFSEGLIRSMYLPGRSSPPCRTLLENTEPVLGVKIGTINEDLSRGVHLLVVRGCARNSDAVTRTKEECGEDFDPAKGNLGITTLEVKGRNRTSDSVLPAEIVHLSQPLESFRANRPFRVTFGEVDQPHVSKLETPTLNGPTAFDTPLTVAPESAGSYDRYGFRVVVDDESGVGKDIATLSLAEIQRLSAPRQLPGSYYSLASNYVFLMLGDPRIMNDDEADVRAKLHFVAVPVITRTSADAGVDASPTP